MKMKKLLSAVISTALVITTLVMPITAKAEEATSGSCGKTENDTVEWAYDATSKTLTISGTGAMKDYPMQPSSLADLSPWLLCATDQTNGTVNIVNIVIGNGVTSIGDYAFRSLTSLAEVEISNTVKSIGQNAFYSCSALTEINIPGSVEVIGANAFEECRALTSVSLNEGLQNINLHAFRNCTALTSITLPNSMESIHGAPFQKCSSLSEINIGSGIKTIGSAAFDGCTGLTEINIPDSVTSIENSAFNGCTNLESVSIPASVESVATDAFTGCTNTVIYYSGSNDTVQDTLEKSSAKEVVTSSVVNNIDSESGSESSGPAVARNEGDGGATGFVLNMLANKVAGANDAINKITWTVTTSNNEKKTFIKEFTSPLSINSAGDYLTFIISGLHDAGASIMMRLN